MKYLIEKYYCEAILLQDEIISINYMKFKMNLTKLLMKLLKKKLINKTLRIETMSIYEINIDGNSNYATGDPMWLRSKIHKRIHPF